MNVRWCPGTRTRYYFIRIRTSRSPVPRHCLSCSASFPGVMSSSGPCVYLSWTVVANEPRLGLFSAVPWLTSLHLTSPCIHLIRCAIDGNREPKPQKVYGEHEQDRHVQGKHSAWAQLRRRDRGRCRCTCRVRLGRPHKSIGDEGRLSSNSTATPAPCQRIMTSPSTPLHSVHGRWWRHRTHRRSCQRAVLWRCGASTCGIVECAEDRALQA